MKATILIILLSSLSYFGYAQLDLSSATKKPYYFSTVIGAGGAILHNNHTMKASQYPTVTFTAGETVTRRFGRRFELNTGLLLTFRAKRKPDYVHGAYGPGTYFPVDVTATKRNHLAIELPVSLRYRFLKATYLSAGLMGRAWFPNNIGGGLIDFLQSQLEIGGIIGVGHKISSHLTIDAYLYAQFNKLDNEYLAYIKSGPNHFIVRDDFVRITASYTFSKGKGGKK